MNDLVVLARCSLLIAVSDWSAWRSGLDPISESDRVSEAWELADPDQHVELATLAGMRFDARAARQFLAALRARAEHWKGRAA